MSWSIRLQLNGRNSFHIFLSFFLSFCMRQKGSYRLINKLHLQPMIGSTIDYIYCSKVREKEKKTTKTETKKNNPKKWALRTQDENGIGTFKNKSSHRSFLYPGNIMQTKQIKRQAKQSQANRFQNSAWTAKQWVFFYMGLTTNGTTKRSRRFYNYNDNDDDDDLLC